MASTFYITTTLPYVNAAPHVGHALEFIQADVIARAKKQQGYDILFNVGTDEHGLKIFEKAAEQGIPVQEFVAQNAQTFKDFCSLYSISYTNFYRTSLPTHRPVAQDLWQTCNDNGHIYTKKYTGLYCVGCESFKTPKELVDGLCPDHNKEPINYDEENYFFALSQQKQQLLNHIDTNTFIIPAEKKMELRNFVEDLQDISISRRRENLPRGVPVPQDEEQVMYVWFDALSNYIGAAGYPDNQDHFNKSWGTNDQPNAVQICGPDNLRFQGAIWQGMLASAKLPLTKTLLVHGMILGPDGNKMSKTLGNVISPFDQVDKYGNEAVRYYMIAGLPTYGNASYKEEELINLHNSHLANSFGNLLNRVIHLANKKEVDLTGPISSDIQTKIAQYNQDIQQAYNNYQLYDAANITHKVALYANEYISRPGQEPWNKEISAQDAAQVLIDCGAMLQTIITGYQPIIPNKCEQAQTMLDTQTKGILFDRISKE